MQSFHVNMSTPTFIFVLEDYPVVGDPNKTIIPLGKNTSPVTAITDINEIMLLRAARREATE